MYICRVTPGSVPHVSLFNEISVNPCMHFRRTADEFIAFFIVKGEMYLKEEQIPYHLTEGDWLLLEPGKEHFGFQQSAHCTYFYIHFRMESPGGQEIDEEELRETLRKNKMNALQEKTSAEFIALPKLCHLKNHETYDAIIYLLNRGKHYFNTYREFYDLQTSCVLIDLLIHLSHLLSAQLLSKEEASTKRSTAIVYALLKDINRNYAEKFSSRLIESRYGGNFDYINRVFKKETGHTVFSYLNTVRIARAKALLISGNLPVNVVARLVGFDDIYYFSNRFKKHTGFSPTQYRKVVSLE